MNIKLLFDRDSDPGRLSEQVGQGAHFLVDKPSGWTSFDVVAKIRNAVRRFTGLRKVKVGHAGTLDPLATGLLILSVGPATKEIHHFRDLPKTYTGTIRFGATTPTFDRESEIDSRYPVEHLHPGLVEKAMGGFRSGIEQTPPAYSAVKVGGKPAYRAARKGEKVEIKPRKVVIYKFEGEYESETHSLHFHLECSKGTYVRSLAYDLGLAVGSGAYLYELCREAIGPYQRSNAFSIEQLIRIFLPGTN